MKKIIIFISPVILLAEILSFNEIAWLLRQQSDIAVLFGVVSICIYVASNFYLINFIIKQFKNN